jgi:hypothetical protein
LQIERCGAPAVPCSNWSRGGGSRQVAIVSDGALVVTISSYVPREPDEIFQVISDSCTILPRTVAVCTNAVAAQCLRAKLRICAMQRSDQFLGDIHAGRILQQVFGV